MQNPHTRIVAHDLELVDLMVARAEAEGNRSRAIATAKNSTHPGHTRGQVVATADVLEALKANPSNTVMYGTGPVAWAELHTAIVDAEYAYDRAVSAVAKHEEAFTGWSRFYLVTNVGGHIHSSTGCSTCRPTTEFQFCPQLSGLDQDAAVAELGPVLCSVCFPDAPVEQTNGEAKHLVEAREAKAARKVVEALPEYKAWAGKSTLVERKVRACTTYAHQIRDLEEGLPRSWDLDERKALLAKTEKQLARATSQRFDCAQALVEALGVNGLEADWLDLD